MDSIARKIDIALATKGMKKLDLCSKIHVASGNLSNMLRRDTFKTDKLEEIANAMGYDLKITFVDKENGEQI